MTCPHSSTQQPCTSSWTSKGFKASNASFLHYAPEEVFGHEPRLRWTATVKKTHPRSTIAARYCPPRHHHSKHQIDQLQLQQSLSHRHRQNLRSTHSPGSLTPPMRHRMIATLGRYLTYRQPRRTGPLTKQWRPSMTTRSPPRSITEQCQHR